MTGRPPSPIRRAAATTPGWRPLLTAAVTDSRSGGVTVSETALTVPEGGTATYTVVLDTEPPDGSDGDADGDPADSDLGVSGALTFTTDDWSTAQTVTVSAAADGDTAAGAATITHTASGGGYDSVSIADVTATEDDNNAAPTITSTATFNVAEKRDRGGHGDGGGRRRQRQHHRLCAHRRCRTRATFAINPTSGVLTFDTAPNYEDPTDVASSDPANAANNNEYVVEVTATSGTSTRALTGDADDHGDGDGCERAAVGAGGADDLGSDGDRLHGDLGGAGEHGSGDPRLHGALPGGAERSLAGGRAGLPARVFALTGLSGATAYQVNVRARNAEDRSNWSPAG